MKIFNIKYFAVVILTVLLWSCQTEQIVSDEIVATKKIPLSDGRPSEADDVNDFKNLQYYHNDKVLNDTIEIKNLMSKARAINIVGNRREIFVTEQEASVFKNKTNSLNTSRSAALDGDDYLHYFYEVSRSPNSGDYYYYNYFSTKGTQDYSVEKNAVRIHVYKVEKIFVNIYDPIFANDFLTGSKPAAEQKINFYLKGNTSNNIYYTVNIRNTTLYNRKVTFESASGKFVYVTVNAGTQTAISGSATGSDPRTFKFNGVSDFVILKHSSNKI